MKRILSLIFLSIISICSIGQFEERNFLGKEMCTEILKNRIGDSLYDATKSRNAHSENSLIKTKKEAIKKIQPILYEKYGKSNIIDEEPYEVHMINGFWFIKGTLPKGWAGGTFITAINSETGKIEFMFHGK